LGALELQNINKDFGSTKVIRDVSLAINDGEFVVFVGPSGCGKSTLLRLIAGLEDISTGTIKIGERVVNDLEPKDRAIAMVFQSYALFPHMNVRDNMAFGLKIAGVAREEMDAKVNEAARMLALGELLDRKPSQLSGGQRQRVAIGRAIVRKPEVFLFDEPLSNLDAALRVSTRAEIAKLHKDLGATMVYVTHDQVEAMTLADRIVVLDKGEVKQFGSPMELYHHPQNQFVAGFIGSPKMNFLPVETMGQSTTQVTVQSADIPKLSVPVTGSNASVGQPVTLAIRPEHVARAKPGQQAIAATVELVERLGHETFVRATLGSGHSVVALLDGTDRAKRGDVVNFAFTPEDCHMFDQNGQALRRLKAPDFTGL
jgi:multiple sugar transport system ATP-binding protein